MVQHIAIRDQIRVSSVNRALAVIGDRWSLLILGQAFLGVRRFDGFLAATGVARSVLSERLRRLAANGLLRKVPAEAGRHEYRLARKGLDLYPLGLMGLRWEARWMAPDAGHAIYLLHRACGCVTEPECRCTACRGLVAPRDVAFVMPTVDVLDDADLPPAPAMRRSRVSAPVDGPLIGNSIDVIGDRWTFLVLSALFLGLRRFDAIQADLKIATNILTDRLRRLAAEGLIRKSAYFDRRLRHEYRLTPKGIDLFPMLMALMRWGDRWLTSEKPAPHLHRHRVCGQELHPVFTCSECGQDLHPWHVRALPSGGRRMMRGERPGEALRNAG